MTSRIPIALAAAALLALPAAALAHHSFAVFFDPQKSVTITGTVTQFRFTNPHGTVALDVSAGRIVGALTGEQPASIDASASAGSIDLTIPDGEYAVTEQA